MRLWHYKLIPYLPKDMLISQWRECIAIKRQWEKGTLKHRLVSYVMKHSKQYFMDYVAHIDIEMTIRGIKHKDKYYNEILDFCINDIKQEIDDERDYYPKPYKEHNNRYLKQCYYNLQEKYDRGIITEKEWEIIERLEENIDKLN